MKIKATVLCENSVFSKRGAIAEHGWAVYLETEQGNLLLDTGQGKGIINNAKLLHLDLTLIKGIVLSHHHWDHTGGLLAVLDEIQRKISVYAHPDLFKESYVLRDGQEDKAGIPYEQSLLEEHQAEFVFSKEASEILPGVFLTGEIPRLTPYETGDKNLVIKTGDGFVVDSIPDDESLVIKTGKGLFIILGCAHAGIINTIEHAIRITGEKRVHTVIGGTHLGPVSKEQQERSLKALHKYDIARLGVSHCTGLPISARLAAEFGERFFFCNVGTIVESL